MPRPPEPRVAGVVLAAGASRRMGENKMLLEVGGQVLARRAAATALAAGLSPVVVVLGRDADAVRAALAGLPCEFAENPDFTGPTSGSLHAGLRRLPTDADAVVLLLADLVGVDETMLRTLVHAAVRTGAAVVASRYDGVVAPPFLFRSELFGELLTHHGEGPGREVVRRHPGATAFLDWPAEAALDVDTPRDLEAWRAERGRG